MAKQGIKIKDLARELGVTSRDLIDRCRAEGLQAQNSITKLDRMTEAKVRSWFSGVRPAESKSVSRTPDDE